MARNSIHDMTIRTLMTEYPGSFTHGFATAISDIMERYDFGDELLEASKRCRRIPDMFIVDEDCMSIFVFEIEDSSKVSPGKLDDYMRLHRMLDDEYWSLHLIVGDRWGNLTPVPLYYTGDKGEGCMFATLFDLVKIYCIRDKRLRAAARAHWLFENPGFECNAFYAAKGVPLHVPESASI
jgi:hypothetical protein